MNAPAASSSPPSDGGGAASILLGLLALAGLLILAHFYLKIFEPAPFTGKAELPALYDRQTMWQAVDPRRVEQRQAELLQCGSRFLGQPGAVRAGELIESAFKNAGLEVIEHQVTTASPITEYREIYRLLPNYGSLPEEKLADVEICPFLPNHLAPVTTGRDGITGRLVLATSDLLHSGQRFDDEIALIDAKSGAFDATYGFDWVRYARMGFKAVIVSDSVGLDDVPWSRVAGRAAGQTSMVSSVPVNFVRLAATPAIFQHVGENIRLRVKVRFVAAPNTTYYGVFHAAHPVRQAICLLVPYDAPSVLPDMAVGAEASVSPAFALQFLEGLQHYKNTLQRDVIFVAYGSSVMGEDGVNHLARILQANTHIDQENPLLKALGIKTAPAANKRLEHLEHNEAANQKLLLPVQRAAALLDDPAFLADLTATANAIDHLPDAAKNVVAEQFSYVMDALTMELSEPALQRKLAFLRSPNQDAHGPEFRSYLAAKKELDLVSGYTGYSSVSLLNDKPEWFSHYGLRERFRTRMAELLAHHQQVARQLEQEKAVARLFNTYSDVSFFANRLVPATDNADPKESLALLVGQDRKTTPAASAVFNVLVNSSHHLPENTAGVDVITPDQSHYGLPQSDAVSNAVTTILDRWGYATYTLYDRDRDPSYDDYPSPILKPYMTRLESLRGSFAVYAGTLLAFAHGVGPVAPSLNNEWIYFSFGGQVLVSGVGQSAVPHQPLDGAVVANRSLENEELYSQSGRYENPIIMADPYGKFRLEYNSNDFPVWWRVYGRGNAYSPIAAGYDQDGAIQFIKDEGDEGQRLFKSLNINIRSGAREDTTIVTFRAAPLSLLDLTNPQTMKDYSAFDFLSKEGLDAFTHQFSISGPGLDAVYLEPDRLAYVLLQSGAPENDLVQETRAFLLGIDDPSRFSLTRDIDGPGYLIADHPFLRDVPLQAARSMAAVNGHRLSLQEQYHMADPQTEAYQQKTMDHLAAAEETGRSLHDVTHSAREAVTYATLNHPVIRRKIVEAVISILWYLGLLVPFAFFFEKLAFAHADVRRQIAAQTGIFLAVFALLWILHPAFAMVRSSLMILLGFVIVLISGGITVLFSSKFKENLEDFRRRQGRVAGANANTLGVVGAAFLLGLNNMHRRKVRTGLTCATLTLLTFVMISFTSVQNGIVEEDIAVGKAPYQGLLIKKEHFEPISDAEVFAFNARYGDRYEVCQRRFMHGTHDLGTNKRFNPNFLLTFQDATGAAHAYDFHSVLQMTPSEPLRAGLRFVGKPVWFTPAQAQESRAAVPILIPDKAASALGITPALVESANGEGVPVRMVGREFRVIGIFTAESLDGLRDLDGLDLRPFNIEAIQDDVQGVKGRGLSVEDDATRIPAEEMFISPVRDVGVPANAALVNGSLAISMPQAGYKEASGEIVSFLEQIARPVFYGLDGVAYKGKRVREVTLAGLVDLIVPLLIAGLTVLNTMRGSVYERSGEIFVYNAVGIAPRYVFFMFMAEAMVYAVVGSVLGFLLSQGVGRVLTLLGWTGGLNMTYASLPTIYASLTIVAAVFVSTWFPARSAMNIAKPADEAGWKLPEPQGDALFFDLPFNFLLRGRMAVLIFFDRYLLDHAEGGAGTFSAAEPRLGVETTADGETVPCLLTQVWLKPFDLAVSQRVVISLPRDGDTGQFKARIAITRLSGTRESWLRLNQSFVQLVRRHFLYWRAIGPVEQEEMFLEAKAKFEREVLAQTPAMSPS